MLNLHILENYLAIVFNIIWKIFAKKSQDKMADYT